MRIVMFPWTRYGTDDILVRKVRKGCPEQLPDILIPMGAWCSNASTEPGECAAKATGSMGPIQHNTVWRMEATLLRRELQGGVHSLDKGLFTGTVGKVAFERVAKKTIVQQLAHDNASRPK